jgi:hypothetical protein
VSAFASTLQLRLIGKGRWATTAPLILDSDVYGGRITIPVDFITDLASVPRVPFAFMVTGSRAPQAAVPHDWLYQHPDFDDRSLADAIFYEIMGIHQPDLGFEAESWAVRQLMWSGVRAGGWHAWNKNEKRAETLNPEWTATNAWPEGP